MANQIAQAFSDAGQDGEGEQIFEWKRRKKYPTPPSTTGSSISAQLLLLQDRIDRLHDTIIKSDDIESGWNNGIVPKFPNYHGSVYATGDTQLKTDVVDNAQGESVKEYRRAQNEIGMEHRNWNVIRPGSNIGPNQASSSVEKCRTSNGLRSCTIRRKENCGNRNGCEIPATNYVPRPQTPVEPDLGAGHVEKFTNLNTVPASMSFAGESANYYPQLYYLTTPSPTVQTKRPITTTRTATAGSLWTGDKTSSFNANTETPPHQLDKYSELTSVQEAVMNMSPSEVREQFLDPMLMIFGAIVIFSGAYMAIAIEEFNAANAFAQSQLANG